MHTGIAFRLPPSFYFVIAVGGSPFAKRVQKIDSAPRTTLFIGAALDACDPFPAKRVRRRFDSRRDPFFLPLLSMRAILPVCLVASVFRCADDDDFQVGSAVKGFSSGDRVALEPGVPCRICEHCKTGRYNLCEGMEFHATPVRNDATGCIPCLASYECFGLKTG